MNDTCENVFLHGAQHEARLRLRFQIRSDIGTSHGPCVHLGLPFLRRGCRSPSPVPPQCARLLPPFVTCVLDRAFMRIRLETLPLGVRISLCTFLQPEDHDLLLQAGVQEWRQPSPWQARLPIELVQLILRDVEPATFYVANCVCSRWRQAARSELLLREVLRAARQSNRQFQNSLSGLQISSADSSRLWRYFVVAAPLRRIQTRPHPRPFRVTTLNFRPITTPPTTTGASARIPPRVFTSDYAGLLAVTATTGLHLYSIERLRIARGRGSEAKAYIATLPFPKCARLMLIVA